MQGQLAKAIQASAAFTGKLGETLALHTLGQLKARVVIVVGLGKADKLGSFALRRASAAAVRACQSLKVKTASTLLNGAGVGNIPAKVAAQALAEGAILGGYQFTKRQTPKDLFRKRFPNKCYARRPARRKTPRKD